MSSETPSLQEFVRHAFETRLSCVYTSIVCEVQSYNRTNRTCVAVPVTTRPVLQEDGSYETSELPALTVPVLFPRGGGAEIVWNLEAGEAVLVICTMTDAGPYLASGQMGIDPGVGDSHVLGSAFALPGVVPTDDVEAGEDHVVIRKKDGAEIHVEDVLSLGAKEGATAIAIAAAVSSNFDALVEAIQAATCGGSGSPLTFVSPSFQSMAATKVKAV
jgi:hypothetical protein